MEGQGERPVLIRHAQPGDADALAAIWRDAGEHFARVDPTAFRVPDEPGLAEWLRSLVPAADDPREALLVAERDGQIIAAVSQSTLEAVADPFGRTADAVTLLRSHALGRRNARPARSRFRLVPHAA